MKHAALLLSLVTTPLTAAEPFAAPPADTILSTLKPGHPRLMIGADLPERIGSLVKQDAVAARIYRNLLKNADRIIDQAPSKYEIPDGRRLLTVSRRVLDRVQLLAFAHRLEGDRKYVDRAWAELETAAGFADWNPSHFLDTAEMTHAFALGYDWLYDEWTPEQRRVLRTAMITKGLEPAMKVYRNKNGWHMNLNNWNQVCNGGIGMGALALADEEPELCSRILHHALQSLPRAMTHYAPDGAGMEGVTYWDYGSRYNIILLDAMRTALGTDFGLFDLPGFKLSGDYQLYLSGAGRVSFDFADCGKTRVSTPQHFWLARATGEPRHSWFRREGLEEDPDRGTVLDLLWWDGSGTRACLDGLPLHRHFRHAETASMRSSWTDPDALVLAIQAGANMNLGLHRHLDLGSFILEADGVRWFIDSGKDGETYQRHRNKQQRWAFYRIRAEGHNTLVIDPAEGPDQAMQGLAPITAFAAEGRSARATVDLSKAYPGSVMREFSMVDGSTVEIRDEIELPKPSDIWWFAHTEAEVTLAKDRRTAVLSQHGKRLKVELLSAGAGFKVMGAKPFPTSPDPPTQAGNQGRRKLAVHLENTARARIAVRMTPGA